MGELEQCPYTDNECHVQECDSCYTAQETIKKRIKAHSCDYCKNETHGDVISRQAAIDAILDLHDCPNGYSDTYDKACIIGVLEELPSAVVPIKDKCLTCIYCENCTDEQTFEEFMFGQDMGNPEDGSL